MLIYDILKTDHRLVIDIIDTIGKVTDPDRRKSLITLVHTELAMHSKAEEEVFYRTLRDRLEDNEIIHNSFDDHDEIDRVVAKLQFSSAKDEEWTENLRHLRAMLQRHIVKEETDLFNLAQHLFSMQEAEELGTRMLEEKGKLGMPNPFMVAARKFKEIVSGD